MHASEIRQPAPYEPPADWHRYLQATFNKISERSHFAVHDFYYEASMQSVVDSWPGPQAALFQIHKILFFMRKFEVYFQQIPPSKYQTFIHKGYFDAYQEAIQAWQNLMSTSPDIHAESVEHVLFISEYLHKFAFQEQASPVDWLALYRQLWGQGLRAAASFAEERQWLEQQLESVSTETRSREKLAAAQLHLNMMDNRAEDFGSHPPELSGELQDISLLLPYVQLFAARSQWQTMLVWLRRMLPLMDQANSEQVEQFSQAYTEVARHLDIFAEWKHAMLQLLPRSYSQYAECLLVEGELKAWIDLHLTYQVSPGQLSPSQLQTVQRQAPVLLLPLYHQAIEQCIMQKSKTSYQQAVHLLQELKTCYDQLGQSARWEQFIHLLREQYARLKALQHELMKGNL